MPERDVSVQPSQLSSYDPRITNSVTPVKDQGDYNGAWLFKNSYGDQCGDGGYYWVSYEDVTLNKFNEAATINDIDPVSKNEYMLANDFTPMLSWSEYNITQSVDYVCMANVYDVSDLSIDYGSINKVMFHAKDLGLFYQVYIVPLSSNFESLPDPSTLSTPLAYGTINYEGYTTANFRTPYSFDETTEKLAIIIKINGDYSNNTKIKISRECTAQDSYNACTYPGESYIFSENKWSDISNGSYSNIGNFCIRPTLVRRESITQNSTLSSNNLEYTGSDVTVNLDLNSNLLYCIKENGNTVLYEDNQFTRTEDSVTFKSSYLSSLSENQYKNIVFEFTDGDNQTLKITRKNNLPEVSVSGKMAIGQTVSAILDDTSDSSGITYQWQSSSDGTEWIDITNANSNTYAITSNEFLKYLRVEICSESSSSFVYPQEKVSSSSATKVVMYGDVDLDGVISIKDSTQVQKYISALVELSDEQFVAADVNGDGYVNVTDSTLISQYRAGIITSFPVESN